MTSDRGAGEPNRTDSLPTLAIQSVIYLDSAAAVERSLASIGRAGELAVTFAAVASVQLIYGDCSPEPVFKAEEMVTLGARLARHIVVKYLPFRRNLGLAEAHNRLLPETEGDIVLILDPGALPAPDTVIQLLAALKRRKVGLVEARQIPVELPKEYDKRTGETEWASASCCVAPRVVLTELGGFDDANFSMTGFDIDLSRRARLAGYKVLHEPSAVVFRQSALTAAGTLRKDRDSAVLSAEAELMMAHKWSQPERVAALLRDYEEGAEPGLHRIAAQYRLRLAEGRLPVAMDEGDLVARFAAEGGDTTRRLALRDQDQ